MRSREGERGGEKEDSPTEVGKTILSVSFALGGTIKYRVYTTHRHVSRGGKQSGEGGVAAHKENVADAPRQEFKIRVARGMNPEAYGERPGCVRIRW